MRVFIIHGAYGKPEENWFPWLKEELVKLGCEVVVPQFPTPEGQTLENWTKAFGKFLPLVDESTVFVGHSLGPSFILSLLERVKCRACFFVAGVIGLLGNETFDRINRSFVERSFDWKAIGGHCRQFTCFLSDDDPYVPVEKGRVLAEKLGVKPILVHGAGHFNLQAGYTSFPLLLEQLRLLISK